MKMEAAGSSVTFTTTYKTKCYQNQNTTIQIRAVVWKMYFYVAHFGWTQSLKIMNVLWNMILSDSHDSKIQEVLKLLHVAYAVT
jgi:hypothetical protein